MRSVAVVAALIVASSINRSHADVGQAVGLTPNEVVWKSVSFSVSGGACGVATTTDQGFVSFSVDNDHPRVAELTVINENWKSLPDTVDVLITFSDNQSFSLVGSSGVGEVDIVIPEQQAKRWLHEFTSTTQFSLTTFDAAVALHSIPLNGTSKAIADMGNCIVSTPIREPAPPFSHNPSNADESCQSISNDLARLSCYDQRYGR